MKIVIVGEAWGKSEDQFKHPLVGMSGLEATLQLGISGLAPYLQFRCRKCKETNSFIEPRCPVCAEHFWPDEFALINHWKQLKEQNLIYITNVFNARPPKNDLGHFFGFEKETEMPSWKASKNTGGSHLLAEHFHHVQRLWRELTDLKPNLIIAFGNAACWAVLGQTAIMSLRGTVNWSERLGIKVLPTFHPAYAMRPGGRAMRPTILADLRKARIEAEFPEIRRPKRYITVPYPSHAGLAEMRQWLTRRHTRLAHDIETVRPQISILGFAPNANEALVVPFRDAHSEGGKLVDIGAIGRFVGNPDAGINFWPSAELEVEAWKMCIEVLESPSIELTFQNGIYDMSYELRMGILPRRATNDTMLWHHSEYPELPKSLGFLGSLYSNDVAWKQMRRSGDSLKRDE